MLKNEPSGLFPRLVPGEDADAKTFGSIHLLFARGFDFHTTKRRWLISKDGTLITHFFGSRILKISSMPKGKDLRVLNQGMPKKQSLHDDLRVATNLC
jgi:hypothetical protein